MTKDGNLSLAKANEGKAKAKGRKPTGGEPKGGMAKVDKKNDEEGKEMEGGVEGEELKFGGLHHPRGGPTMVSVQVAPTEAGDEQGRCKEGGGATHT